MIQERETNTASPIPVMELKRARWICKAINQRAFFAMGLTEKVDSLEGITLSEMLEAASIVKFANSTAELVDGARTTHVIPADRLIAAVYALEHFEGDGEAVAVMPIRFLGETNRRAIGIVTLPGLRDPEADEVAA